MSIAPLLIPVVIYYGFDYGGLIVIALPVLPFDYGCPDWVNAYVDWCVVGCQVGVGVVVDCWNVIRFQILVDWLRLNALLADIICSLTVLLTFGSDDWSR